MVLTKTDLVLAGNFVLSSLNQNGTTSHPASIVSYDPVSNTFTSNFNSGIYEEGVLVKLQATPLYFSIFNEVL